ncbi:MAG: AzlD domain-containing protein [Eubacterium sp.]|jgi:branched-subunit amino acid transport protein|nr:AzlD domain-containing protein [Eubacterium sp.]MBR1674102.1 AzlD domain-containing protein [Eubacterium sp.]
MELKTFFIYLLLMAGTTYLIRVIPFVLVNRKVTNKYVRSFLYYIPYAVLAAMTVPAAFYATRSVISAVSGILVAALVSLKCRSLVVVAAAACITVYLVELFV